jgi:CTP:molybdopterin cytidylyltransferase MocA
LVVEERLCIALLAAGSSRRFGEDDKLAQDLGGRMLGLHMAKNLAQMEGERVVITSAADHPCAADWRRLGFAVEVNADAARGMGTSVACAARFAAVRQASALLIVLADMPHVPLSHCQGLVAGLAKSSGDLLATSDGQRAMPPAIFNASQFDALANLSGDQGARHMIRAAETIPLKPELLIDIDTPGDLARA